MRNSIYALVWKWRIGFPSRQRVMIHIYLVDQKNGDRMIKQLLNSVIAKYRDLSVASRSIICLSLRLRQIIRSLRNHDDDGNNNVTNLHIWQRKTIVFARFARAVFIFDISQTFSFFLRREMTCFAVVWTTWPYDDKCSILSSYLRSAGCNLIPW